MMTPNIYDIQKTYPIYRTQDIQAWEKAWFNQQNSSYGLMQQAALAVANHIENIICQSKNHSYQSNILVWCGTGNNGGDGYLVASYLKQKNFDVFIYAPELPNTPDAQTAKACAEQYAIPIYQDLNFQQISQDLGYSSPNIDIHVDALFGNGLNRKLSDPSLELIYDFNVQDGLKIAIDLPSGLHPDTGCALPIAVHADYTLCLLGLKLGLFTAQGRDYAGQVIAVPLIPNNDDIHACAEISTYRPSLPQRKRNSHKGHFYHVLIVGGHANMGGAVMMAGEAAIASGAGKVTILCHNNHHAPIVSRSPNIMLKNIDSIYDADFADFLEHIDVVAFGMGLGRDDWAEKIYQAMLFQFRQAKHLKQVIFDADALWFLANNPQSFENNYIFTPHASEAARLLHVNVKEIDHDRLSSITRLKSTFGGNWVLKGAGSLSLEHNTELVQVCAFGNAGMATAGMGDVLSGMLAALIPLGLPLADCVALHALAGDKLAVRGEHGLQAHHMPLAIYDVINNSND
ncbi:MULTISPECIES: NAD(P)H-hydrate dehydratase [unclassified Acinetobacter]|uniref:NAD(P)H-hydrate dehydratase n=1 Tax=unclassified Acinetobacter TaxID=196816 RepID=UPI0035B95067